MSKFSHDTDDDAAAANDDARAMTIPRRFLKTGRNSRNHIPRLWSGQKQYAWNLIRNEAIQLYICRISLNKNQYMI